MNRLKRFFAGAVTLAFLLSVTTTVFAQEAAVNEQPTETPVVEQVQISSEIIEATFEPAATDDPADAAQESTSEPTNVPEPTPEAVVTPVPAAEAAEEPAATAAPTTDVTAQATAEPVVTPEPAPEPDFTVEIEIADEKSIYYVGDELTLMGNLSGLENIGYILCWEYCDNSEDEWAAAPGVNDQQTYTYQLSEENANWVWRLAVIVL